MTIRIFPVVFLLASMESNRALLQCCRRGRVDYMSTNDCFSIRDAYHGCSACSNSTTQAACLSGGTWTSPIHRRYQTRGCGRPENTPTRATAPHTLFHAC
ncbi:hypothetical protein GE09DRAFT_1119926 [Coniochaeta sp. 2T2.1]|nr:hypothetical protein GE09DRAFT_1119926 [Coniochaeta sp. 2T2.1]